ARLEASTPQVRSQVRTLAIWADQALPKAMFSAASPRDRHSLTWLASFSRRPRENGPRQSKPKFSRDASQPYQCNTRATSCDEASYAVNVQLCVLIQPSQTSS